MAITFGARLGFSRADISSYTAGSTVNDQATTAPFTRVGSTGAAANLTSLASPAAGQLRLFSWNRSGDVLFKHETGPTAANRLRLGGGFDADVGASGRKGLLCWYDATTQRWRGVV